MSIDLWDASLRLVQEEEVLKSRDVQVVDLREPTMQSVHTHPQMPFFDCGHLCMNSAAMNSYLNAFWNEVFS